MPTPFPTATPLYPQPPPQVTEDGSARTHRLFWPFQCGFWLLITGLAVGMGWAVDPSVATPWEAVAFRMVTGFLLTAAVHWLFQMPRLQRFSRPIRWSLLCLVSTTLLIGSLLPVHLVGGSTAVIWMGTDALGQILPRLAASIFWCSGYVATELIEGLYATELRVAHAEAHAARREATAHEHEVHRLHAQMNPHFLFNALNAVVACKNSPSDVARVTQDLADFLRSALRESRLLEPLSRELQTLEKYLAVQQARFGPKLDCRIVCDRAARGVMVPPMMVQPLLENAIAYGMQTSSSPLRVEVSARVRDGQLEVVVFNTGSWVAPDAKRSPGTGLKTLRKRLALLIGPAAVVEVDSDDTSHRAGSGSGVRISIRMPAERTVTTPPIMPPIPQGPPA